MIHRQGPIGKLRGLPNRGTETGMRSGEPLGEWLKGTACRTPT